MSISFLFAVPAAYGISRFRIPGARIIIMLFLVTQMLPSSLLLTPMFLTFSRLKLLNTYIAPILAVTTITIPFTLLILRPMFMACPKEIEESARIDGCNRFSAFIRIVMPVIKSGLVTVCCFGFVHGWNDLVYSLTFNTRKNLFPMTSAIYNLMNEYGVRWNWIMAYGCMLILPPIAIFITAQKYVISGLVGGAVKG
jgi:multiple sugar transport system permease protein